MEQRTRTRGSELPKVTEVVASDAIKIVDLMMATEQTSWPAIPETVKVRIYNPYTSVPAISATFTLPATCFTWTLHGRYWYWYPSGATATAKGEVSVKLKSIFESLNYYDTVFGQAVRLERIDHFDYDRMTDIKGSGFNARRKKEFVVNPCDSISNLFSLTSSSPNPGDSFSVRSVAGGLKGVVSIEFKRLGSVPFTPAAFDSFRKAWLPDRDPSGYGFLYSQACERINAADLEILATIGELRETVSYLYSRMRDIGSILRSVRRRDFSFIKKWENLSKADLWLEARYAIRPLFYDVQGIISALRKDGKLKHTLAKYSSKSDTLEESRTFSFSSDGYSYLVQGTQVGNYTAKGGAYARLALDLEFAYKFGTTNIASASWELVPYSFIVDWFFSVSSFIAGLNPNPVYGIENGFVSVSSEDFFTGTIIGSKGGITQSFGFSDSVQRHSRIPYDNRFNIALDLNLNFHKFVDLYLIFGRR